MRLYKKVMVEIPEGEIKPEIKIQLNSWKEVSDELEKLTQSGRPCIIDIREFKEKRSLNQNAYYWELVNNIAKAINSSDEEVHKELLKDYGTIKGVYQVLKGQINEKYYTEITDNTYIVYKGSSEMNTKEFSRLLEGTIYEAKEIGLQVEYEKYYTEQ